MRPYRYVLHEALVHTCRKHHPAISYLVMQPNSDAYTVSVPSICCDFTGSEQERTLTSSPVSKARPSLLDLLSHGIKYP